MMQPSPSAADIATVYAAIIEAAKKHRENGRAKEAVDLLEFVVQAAPHNSFAQNQLGLALIATGVDGTAHLFEAVRQDIGKLDYQADLGDACEQVGDRASGELCYRRFLPLAPARPELILRFGLMLARGGRLDEAEKWVRRAFGYRKVFGKGYLVLGGIQHRAGRLGDAVGTFYRGVVADPDCGDCYVALTGALSEAGAPLDQVMKPNRIAADRFPYRADVVMPLVQYLRDIGSEAESVRYASPVIQRQMDDAAKDAIGQFGFRILDPDVMLGRIGELAFQLDLHVKMKLLGWLPPFISILLAPADGISNRSFLGCWRRYISIVEDPALISQLEPLKGRISFNPVYVPLPDGRAMSKNRAYFAVQEEWQRQGRGALLDLDRPHMERGRKTLEGWGMPSDAWFVCVHVRESGYMKEAPTSSEAARNADIRAYLPAIEEVTRRGGWVIRLGDPSMTPLPPMERVVDYALSDSRSDWMDIYLAASCRFVLGTTSGMSLVASMFGVPISAANFFPTGERLHTASDVFIPKLMRESSTGRILTFDECLAMPLALTYDAQRLPDMGIELIDNDPEDIRGLAIEMLERTSGATTYQPDEESRQRRWDELGRSYSTGNVGSRVGRTFLARHRHLLRPC